MSKKKTVDNEVVRVKYDSSAALFASQVILSSNKEDIVLDFSSGIINSESGDADRVLPIHTRIALTRSGAARLQSLLTRALAKPDEVVED